MFITYLFIISDPDNLNAIGIKSTISTTCINYETRKYIKQL